MPAWLWSSGSDFSDAAGFGTANYLLIRLTDVNGDGFLDVCARTASGIICALNTTTGSFCPATLWISEEFTDALGWAPDAYGSTIQFGDINGDGRADV